MKRIMFSNKLCTNIVNFQQNLLFDRCHLYVAVTLTCHNNIAMAWKKISLFFSNNTPQKMNLLRSAAKQFFRCIEWYWKFKKRRRKLRKPEQSYNKKTGTYIKRGFSVGTGWQPEIRLNSTIGI